MAGSSRNARGSALLAALLVLAVLTMVGVSLALITGTESRIGGNERAVQRVRTAAESGIHVAVGKALAIPDWRAVTFDLPEDGWPGAVVGVARVEVSPMVPLLSRPCDLCQINQGSEFFQIDHAVSSRALRLAWTVGMNRKSDPPRHRGQAAVSVTIGLQPARPSAEPLAVLRAEDLAGMEL